MYLTLLQNQIMSFKKILILSVVFIILFNAILLSQSKIYSEAPIKFENGIKMSTQLTVNFKIPAINLSKGIRKADLNNIGTEYNNVKKYFNELEKKYGKIALIKQIPDAVWGDVWRKNINTGEKVKLHDMSQLFTIKFEKNVPIDEIIYDLENLEEVEYAHQPIQVVEYAEPYDTYYSSQYSLPKINAPKAWDLTKGMSTVKVAILEVRGVKTTHTDLTNKIASGSDVTYEAIHGTMVSGIVGATTDNNSGISSLGWNTKIMPLDWDYYNQAPSLVNKLQVAIDSGCAVINCSFGTIQTTEDPTCVPEGETKQCFIIEPVNYSSFASVISNAISAGRIVVAAAGNTSHNLGEDGFAGCNPDCDPFPYVPYPASYPGVIAVSATDINDTFAAGKDYNTGSFIDFAAPGMNILTTSYDLVTGADTYANGNGTSFASPLVAALAGLVKSINSSINASQFEQILINSSVDLGTTGKDIYYGYGRIDAYKALKYTLENYGGTLSGNIKFTENITIASGKTLTILAGSTVNFTNGAKLIINGNLIANGTSSNKIYFTGVNKTGGIQFNQNSTGSVKYAVIDNANTGIFVERALPTIQNCEIKNCNYGIVLNNNNYVGGSINISSNNIHNNVYKGISFTLSGGNVYSNTIAYNSSGSYAGQGIYCTYSSLPSIGQSGGNAINYNDIGLYTYNGLNMTLATSNSFTGNYGYHIKSENNCTITAYNSFSPTQTAKFCATTGSTIYTNYGTITTCTPLPPSIAATHLDEVKSSINSTKDGGEDLTIAKLFEIWNDYRTNKSKEDFIAYLNTVISAKLSTEVTAIAEFILAGYDENSKINTYKNLAKKYEGLPVTEIMLYELFVDYYLNGDLKEAEKQYKLLEKNYRYSELTTDAKRFLDSELKTEAESSSLAKGTNEKEENSLPTEYVLEQNHPNPFNPTTIINYTIPSSSEVKITIYDIAGRLIKSFDVRTQSSGRHQVEWDGTNASGLKVSSGTYIYRMEAVSLEGSAERFVQSKKMILLK